VHKNYYYYNCAPTAKKFRRFIEKAYIIKVTGPPNMKKYKLKLK